MERKRIKANISRIDDFRQAEVSRPDTFGKAQFGFSLLEMMIVIIIIGVLAAIAIPSFSSWKEKQAVSNATNALLSHLKQARNLALAENRSVRITFGSTAYTFDADTTGSCGPCRVEVIGYSQFSSNLAIAPTTTRTFTSRGTANSGTITLSASGKSKSIVMNVIGRAYIQ